MDHPNTELVRYSSPHCTGVANFHYSKVSVIQSLHVLFISFQLEETVAEFMGTEAAITVGMGFATNSLNLPRLVST